MSPSAPVTVDSLPDRVVIVAGTYEGVLAGWELNSDSQKLAISFASPVHDGSVRSLCVAQAIPRPAVGKQSAEISNADSKGAGDNQEDGGVGSSSSGLSVLPGSLLSCGYDEMLRTHDFSKRLTSSGEVRTPADLGTPVCSSFAPPAFLRSSVSEEESPTPSTHCLVGFSSGKLVIYKKRDWVVQHVLAGHDGGIASLAVHPSGKLALSGGSSDGKLKLWDLTKGRLAYVSKVNPAVSSVHGRTHYDPIVSIVWSTIPASKTSKVAAKEVYGFCYGSHLTVRAVDSGKDLLDVDLPSRVNQVCLMTTEEQGLFVAAACNDGSLPVLEVQDDESNGSSNERRAIMAIEPVDGPVAGEERFKCIQSVSGYYVATANSAGVVSLMNLQGAVNMILKGDDEVDSQDDEETPVHAESDEEEEAEDSDMELAVDIIDSIRLGTGARITCLAAWSTGAASKKPTGREELSVQEENKVLTEVDGEQQKGGSSDGTPLKRKRERGGRDEVQMDSEALEKARDLVSKAKKIQKKKERKKLKKSRR